MTRRAVFLLAELATCLCACAAPPALEWDPADHGSDMVASGRALVRNPPGLTTWQTARSRTSQSGGVRTVHIAIDDPALGTMVGVTNGRTSVALSLGEDGNSIGYWSVGATRMNLTGVSLPAFAAGDVVGIQADLDAHVVRFRRNDAEWSSPFSIASLGPDVYVGASVYVGADRTGSLRIVSDDWNDFRAPTVNVVAAGDSITLNGAVLRTYVPRIGDELWTARRHWARTQQFAANGVSWNYAWPFAGYPRTLIDDGPLRVDTARTSLPNWLIAFAGTNGIAIARHSAADEYSALQAYVRARIAAGWKPSQIIVCTMLPRAGVAEDVRRSYNALIVADTANLGYHVARLDLDPALETLDATNYPDGTHPSDAMHARIARVIAPLIEDSTAASPSARPLR